MITTYIELVEQVEAGKLESTKWVHCDKGLVPFLPLEDIVNGSRDLKVWKRHANRLNKLFAYKVTVTITDEFILAYFNK